MFFLLVFIIFLLYLVIFFLRSFKKNVLLVIIYINSYYIEWFELRVVDDFEVGFFMIIGLFMYFFEYLSLLIVNFLFSMEKLYKVGVN